eukprot:Awhi_evm1s10652
MCRSGYSTTIFDASNVYVENPQCDDNILGFGEDYTDCGEVCGNVCSTCGDGIQNQDETGIDCGGSVCQPCEICKADI